VLNSAVIVLLYFLVTTRGDSLLGYFRADICKDEAHLRIIFGVHMVGTFIGPTEGHILFIKASHRIGTIAAVAIDGLSVIL
jgi:hypothetical protein